MKKRLAWVIVLLLFLASIPGVDAQSVGQQAGGTNKCVKACDPLALNGGAAKQGNESVWVVLYGHFTDPFMAPPLNALPPDPIKEPDRRTPVAPCIDGRTGTPADLHFNSCDFRMVSAPPPGPAANESQPPPPGIGRNTTILSDTVTLYVTLSSQGPAPHVGVYGRLETPKYPYGRQVLAESDPKDPAVRKMLVSGPGDAYDAWEFEVKMKVRQPVLPAEGGFVVFFRVFQVEENAGTLQSPGWQLRYGVKHPPRVVFQVGPPLTSDGVRLSIWRDSFFARWSFSSALGSYDVRDANLAIRQTSGPAIAPERIELVILKRSVDFNGQRKPLNATWRIDYANAPLADGHYEFVANATNLQGTYVLQETMAFDVEKAKPLVNDLGPYAKKSPGPAWVLVMVGLLVLALVRRRS